MQRQQGNFPTPNQIEDQVEELRRQMSEMAGTPYRRFTAPEPGSSFAQFSRSQLRTIHDAPTVDEKAELIRRFKEQNQTQVGKEPKTQRTWKRKPMQNSKSRNMKNALHASNI